MVGALRWHTCRTTLTMMQCTWWSGDAMSPAFPVMRSEKKASMFQGGLSCSRICL
jgi:hypothetical protein